MNPRKRIKAAMERSRNRTRRRVTDPQQMLNIVASAVIRMLFGVPPASKLERKWRTRTWKRINQQRRVA